MVINRIVRPACEFLALFEYLQCSGFQLNIDSKLLVAAHAWNLTGNRVQLADKNDCRSAQRGSGLVRQWRTRQCMSDSAERCLIRERRVVVAFLRRYGFLHHRARALEPIVDEDLLLREQFCIRRSEKALSSSRLLSGNTARAVQGEDKERQNRNSSFATSESDELFCSTLKFFSSRTFSLAL